MKARVKETGKIIECNNAGSLFDYARGVYTDIASKQKYKWSELEFINEPISETKKIDWEQRRFELVKAALQGYCADSEMEETYNTVAEFAINQADAVIEKLKAE